MSTPLWQREQFIKRQKKLKTLNYFYSIGSINEHKPNGDLKFNLTTESERATTFNVLWPYCRTIAQRLLHNTKWYRIAIAQTNKQAHSASLSTKRGECFYSTLLLRILVLLFHFFFKLKTTHTLAHNEEEMYVVCYYSFFCSVSFSLACFARIAIRNID